MNEAPVEVPRQRSPRAMYPLFLDFGIHHLNQGFDVSITECKCLKPLRVVGVTGHVVRAQSAGELRITQDSHNLQKIHVAFIGVHFQEVMKSPADVSHMDLVDLASFTQVFDNRQNLRAGVP